jgi:Zn-dependent peptidase ImmA (M78 family)
MINSHKPLQTAQEFLRSIGWTKPGDLSLDEMLNFKGASIHQAELKNCEGRVILHGQNSIVRINSNITNEGKKNFVLAHELGHILLHTTLMPVFSDTRLTLSDWYKKGTHEIEANTFATELLMPQDLFKQKVKGKKLTISLMEDVANYFKVSLTASFLRYLTLGDFPLMVVFIERGIIEWKHTSNDFPFPYLPLKNKVPIYSVAGDYFFNKVTFGDEPDKVNVIDWFPEDFQAQKLGSWQIYEQCFHVSSTGIISCLWTF